MQVSDSVFVGASDLSELMRRIDWRETAVGPADAWPQSVRAIVRLMLTSRYAMWMGWGPELTFFYNDAYARILSAKHPAALGMPTRQVWAEIWPDIGPRIDHVLATGEATWDEGLMLFLERSGFPEETYHTFSYSPVHDDDGRITGMFCVVTEETTRVIGERRIALLRDFGTRLASSQTTADVWAAAEAALAADSRDLPFALAYVFGGEGTAATLTARVNIPAGDPIAGEQVDVGDPLWPVAGILDGTAGRLTIVDLPPGISWPRGPWNQPPQQAAVVALYHAGQTRPAGLFIAGLNPHRPIDAEFESFITLFAGQLEAGLANAQAYVNERLRAEALAQIDRAKTAFFSNVSHEFRTPLTLLLGPLEDHARAAAGDPSQEWLDQALRNGRRLQKLVNSLLEFSRIEAGRVQASFEPTDLAQFTEDLASLFRASIEKAGLRLRIDAPPLPEPVFVDRDMWEKIVLNLLSNAFKFTLDGEIAVSLGVDGERVRLIVRDTGTGIPSAELPRVFDRFHRVESAKGRTYEGTGIGLALTAELVRMHGGAVTAESVEGQGTAFIVTIPRGSAHLPAARIRRGEMRAPASQGGHAFVEEASRWLPSDVHDAAPLLAAVADAGEALPPSHARILVADDNADMRDYLRRLLGARWRVTVCANGRAALASLREHLPDLLITDVMMPELDGFGLLAAVRADERTRELPVMMLSARAGEESRVEGLEAGADDYVVKPFSARELVARVETHLLRAEMRAIERTHIADLDTARRSAETASRAKDEFLANLSHELRTPLNAVIGWTQMLLDGAVSSGASARALQSIQRNARVQQQLIADILDVSNIIQGRLRLQLESVRVRDVLNAALESVQPALLARNITLTIEGDPDVSLTADPARLQQILWNLLTNAAKFTPPAGTITVSVEPGDALIRIEVRDTGVGIAAEALPHVFQRFWQADASSTRTHSGLGLGLAIVRHLVELHGGSITVASGGKNQGAAFTIVLPARAPVATDR